MNDSLVVLTYSHDSSIFLYSAKGLQCKTNRSFPIHSEKKPGRKFLVIALFTLEYDDTKKAFPSSAWDMHAIRKFFLRLPAQPMITAARKGLGSFITYNHCRLL